MARHLRAPEGRGSDSTSAPVRLLYILGAGRSGSTVVGLLLGSTHGMTYLGEVDAWFRLEGKPNFEGAEREEFWQRVLDRTSPSTRALFGDVVWSRVESTRSILSPARTWSGRIRRRYRAAAGEVLSIAAEESGAEWIVDSSHYPLRLRELQRVPGLDVAVLYLYRDPRSVVRSFVSGLEEQGNKTRLAANAYLWLTTAVSSYAYLRSPRRRRALVRFEEARLSPQAVVERVRRELCDLDTTEPLPTLLPTGVTLQGNRLLAEEAVRFEPSASSPPRDAVTRFLQLPWTFAIQRILARG